MNLDEVTVLTCTYNHVELVDFMLKSLFMQIGRTLGVVVMNNGDEQHSPLPEHSGCIREVDNSDSHLLKNVLDNRTRAQPSDRHCAAIDYALRNEIHTEWCMLVDDDVLFLPTIRELLVTDFKEDVVGEVGYDRIRKDRVFPYMCLINVRRMRETGSRYFDGMNNLAYAGGDTGYALLRLVSKNILRICRVRLSDYILHFKNASLKSLDCTQWLDKNRQLYEQLDEPMNFESLFRHSIVVSVDAERLNRMRLLFSAEGLPMPGVTLGCTDRRLHPITRCHVAHKLVVEYASQHNWPFLLVFEDDAYPRAGVKDILSNLEIPKDADFAILGWYKGDFERGDKWVKLGVSNTVYATHAYVIRSTAYEKVIKWQTDTSSCMAPEFMWNYYDGKPFSTTSYVYGSPLFVQYTVKRSNNGHVGFAVETDRREPPPGYNPPSFYGI